MPLLKLLDRLGCKSNGRTHFLLGKNIARSLYRIHDAVQRRRGYAGVMATRCSGRCRVAGDVRSTTAWRRGGGLPNASVPRIDRVATRVFSGETGRRRTSCLEPPTLPLSFIWHCAMGAHQPCWAGRPDQDASQGPSWPLGQLVEINPTCSWYQVSSEVHRGIEVSSGDTTPVSCDGMLEVAMGSHPSKPCCNITNVKNTGGGLIL